MKAKVAIIGWDAATFDVIRPLIAAGALPNLQGLMERGTHGQLLSTLHPLSPVAWTSFLTGLRPGGHRLYGFITSSHGYVDGPQGYTAGRPANASAIGAVPLWQVMNRHGVSAGC